MDYSMIEGIILHQIFAEDDISDWNKYKENIIRNFRDINYMESIANYVPCQRKLYITRPKLRMILHLRLKRNKNIFQEIGYEIYEPIKERITFDDFNKFVEDCVKILVAKQQGK